MEASRTPNMLRVRMWLEYALDGDETARKATGLSVNGCIAVALGLMEGGDAWAKEQDAKHSADCLISGMQFSARAKDK
jgi:hypothetical protein